MIEINLIPDVKRELLKAQAWRSFIVFVCFAISVGAIALVVVVLGIMGGQALLIGNNDNSIKSDFAKIQGIQDVDKTTTLQNQLSEIENLRKASPNTSRILNQILVAIRPTGENGVDFTAINYEPETRLITLEGQTVNGSRAIDALQKTIRETVFIYSSKADKTCSEAEADNGEENCFKEKLIADSTTVDLVELSSGESEEGGQVARYKITFTLNPKALRFSTKNFAVKSPSKKDVTDSRTQIPDDIFKAKNQEVENGQ